MSADIASHLFDLERQLHTRPIRINPAEVAGLLCEGFREFGSSGRVWTKSEIITELAAETPSTIASRDYAFHSLGPTLALVTYISHNGKREALRSSIWRMEDGAWRILFHQGTPIPSP